MMGHCTLYIEQKSSNKSAKQTLLSWFLPELFLCVFLYASFLLSLMAYTFLTWYQSQIKAYPNELSWTFYST